ncbi:MAG: hypothetical protein ABFC89_08070 [Methanospirillum sp.]
MTGTSPERTAGRSLESFAKEIDDAAEARGTTRAAVLGAVIAGLEERIAEDSAILALARRLEAGEPEPVPTPLDHAIDIVSRGDGQRPWPGKDLTERVDDRAKKQSPRHGSRDGSRSRQGSS